MGDGGGDIRTGHGMATGPGGVTRRPGARRRRRPGVGACLHRAPLLLTLFVALGLASAGLAARPAWSQQVYSFADIMAALTVRLPTGQTVTEAQPLTLQEAIRSLTLEQAVRTPANVARIAGVMAQVRRDDSTRRAVRDGIAAALAALVAGGQMAPLGRDLMMEQVATALGLGANPARAPAPGAPAGSADPATALPAPPIAPASTPVRSAPLSPPEPPVIPAPGSGSGSPPLVGSAEPPRPRAAPVAPATTATLPPAHLAAPDPPAMPAMPAMTPAPAGSPGGVPWPAPSPSPYPAPPGAAPSAPVPTTPAGGTPAAAMPAPGAPHAPPPYAAAPYPAAPAMPSPSVPVYPTPGTAQAITPWLGPGLPPGQALFPSSDAPGTLMDLPPAVTAPPATVADSGS